jgi:hypothetical protein
MWQVVSSTANLLSDCDLRAVARTVAGDGDMEVRSTRSGKAINATLEVTGDRWL